MGSESTAARRCRPSSSRFSLSQRHRFCHAERFSLLIAGPGTLGSRDIGGQSRLATGVHEHRLFCEREIEENGTVVFLRIFALEESVPQLCTHSHSCSPTSRSFHSFHPTLTASASTVSLASPHLSLTPSRTLSALFSLETRWSNRSCTSVLTCAAIETHPRAYSRRESTIESKMARRRSYANALPPESELALAACGQPAILVSETGKAELVTLRDGCPRNHQLFSNWTTIGSPCSGSSPSFWPSPLPA